MTYGLPIHASQQNPHAYVSHQLMFQRKTGRAYVLSTSTARNNGRQTMTKRDLQEFLATSTRTEVASFAELVGALVHDELMRHDEDADNI